MRRVSRHFWLMSPGSFISPYLQGGGRGGQRNHEANTSPFSNIHHVAGDASGEGRGAMNGDAAAEVDNHQSNIRRDNGIAIEDDLEISGLDLGDSAAESRLYRSQLQAQRALGGPAILHMTFNPQEPPL